MYRLIIAFIAISLFGCGSGITTTKLILGKDIKTINNWKIYLIPLENNISLDGKIIDVTNNPQVQHDKEYVNEVKHILTSKYDFGFFDNYPSAGRIYIRVVTHKNLNFKSIKYNVQDFSDYDPASISSFRYCQPIVLIDKEAPVDKYKLKRNVSFVEIDIYNEDLKLVGEIDISGNKKIKPSHIADRINQYFNDL